jgi:hypothetical protein
MKSFTAFTNSGRAASRLGLLGLVAMPFAASLAAPPGGGGTAPPSVDIAYMSIGGAWGEPSSATVRGMGVTSSGASSSDVVLWKAAIRFSSAITWDPNGGALAMHQEIDSKGTRALVVGIPGQTLRTLLRLPSGTMKSGVGSDKLSWGRGCDGRSVIVFGGAESTDNYPRLYVIDPYADSPQAQVLYKPEPYPGPENSPSLGAGLAFSPLGGNLAFTEYSAQLGGRAVVALTLTCAPGSALPVAVGTPQPLFPAECDGGSAWTQSLDWSGDGKRLVLAMGRHETVPGGGLQYATRLWIGELSYDASSGTEQVAAASTSMQRITSGPAGGSQDYSDFFPSWAPSAVLAACDRLAFAKNGAIMLLDVPRDGFTTADCAVPAPKLIGGKAVNGMDWK